VDHDVSRRASVVSMAFGSTSGLNVCQTAIQHWEGVPCMMYNGGARDTV
jgi:hypothetical protein